MSSIGIYQGTFGLLAWAADQRGRGEGEKLWQMILVALGWSIWEERNGRTFEDKVKSRCCIMDAILSKTFNWIFVDQFSDRPSFLSWIFDWDLVIM